MRTNLILLFFFTFGYLFPKKLLEMPCSSSLICPVIAQTASLIIFVLGSYSYVAAAFQWDMVYFQVTWPPKAITIVMLGLLVSVAAIDQNSMVKSYFPFSDLPSEASFDVCGVDGR